MFNLKVLSQEDTEKLLNIDDVLDVVENVYKLKAEDKTKVFPLVFNEFEPGVADVDIKSGWIKGYDIFGLKEVAWFGENAQKNMPTLMSTIMIWDSVTGAPLGVLDGNHITGMRTGAAGALGAKYLARKDSETLLLVGAGHIATFQIAATLKEFPDLRKVLIYDAMDYGTAEKMANGIRNKLENEFSLDVNEAVTFGAVSDIEEATRNSDIIITVTPSKNPIIMKEWVKPGTHFSCIGSDMVGKEEIDPEIFRNARVFVDDIEQCINVGEVEIPIKKGTLTRDRIVGEIGEIPTGKTKGRENDEQITVFDATGTALLDLLTGKLALDTAKEKELGINAVL